MKLGLHKIISLILLSIIAYFLKRNVFLKREFVSFHPSVSNLNEVHFKEKKNAWLIPYIKCVHLNSIRHQTEKLCDFLSPSVFQTRILVIAE